MDIQAAINEKIQVLQDLNKQMGEISNKIGALQEQGRALHGAGLQVKGAIDALAELAAKEEAAKSKLTLPEKTLVAADGKTPIAAPVEVQSVIIASETATPVVETHEAKAPVLDVVQ